MLVTLIKMLFGLLWTTFLVVTVVIFAPYDYIAIAIEAARNHDNILGEWKEYSRSWLNKADEVYGVILNLGQ